MIKKRIKKKCKSNRVKNILFYFLNVIFFLTWNHLFFSVVPLITIHSLSRHMKELYILGYDVFYTKEISRTIISLRGRELLSFFFLSACQMTPAALEE